MRTKFLVGIILVFLLGLQPAIRQTPAPPAQDSCTFIRQALPAATNRPARTGAPLLLVVDADDRRFHALGIRRMNGDGAALPIRRNRNARRVNHLPALFVSG